MQRTLALTGLVILAALLSCHDSVSLPPVEGPPLAVPEARSGSGSPLAQTELKVIHTSPEGQLDSPHLQITVSFNKPMVALDKVEEQQRKSPLRIEPAIEGKQRWLGTRTLVYENVKPLPGSSRFSVTVLKGVKALDGSELAEERSWSFTTPRLAVTRVRPYKGQRWQRPDSQMRVSFNQPVSAAAVQKALTLRATPRSSDKKAPSAGQTVAVTVQKTRSDRTVVLIPKEPLPLDARVELELDKSLTGEEGPLPMNKPYRSHFSTYGPLKVLGLGCTKRCDPDDSIYLKLSNPVRRDLLHKVVRVDGKPLPRTRSRYASSTFYINTELKARARHTVSFRGALRDTFGQTLSGAKPLTLTTGDYRPMVYFPLNTGVLEPIPSMRLPLVFRNAESATLYSQVLTPAGVAALLGHSDYWDYDTSLLALRAGTVRRPLKVAGKRNTRLVKRVDLRPLLPKDSGRRGVLAVELSATVQHDKERDTRVRRAVVRVTDLAITAKYAPHAALVWVTSLASGEPVAGAQVEIWRKGDEAALWRGTTDKVGLALAPGMNRLGGDEENQNLLFFAKKDGDLSYVQAGTQSGISPWDFGLDSAWDSGAASVRGLLFTDRGLYRPGEKVYVKGIMRRDAERGMVTPSDEEVALTVSDARGEKLATATRQLSEFGTLSWELDLPPGAPLGSYSIMAKAAKGGTVYGRFSVEEYRPAEFAVSVDSDKAQYLRGETMDWSASGRYLFGSAMRNAKANWTIYRAVSHFSPPGREGYVFHDEINWWGSGSSPRRGGFVARGTGRLDGAGAYQNTAKLQPPPGAGPQTYEVELTVTDISRQAISARTRALVHPGPYYLGAKPKETFLAAGKPLQAEVIAADPKGKAVAGVDASGVLFRREWLSVRKKGMNGAHYFVTRVKDTEVGNCRVKTRKKAVPCKIAVPKAGYYVFRLQPTGGPHRGHVASSFGLYASGSDYVAWRRDNEDRVELVTDRKTYKVGQTARILVKSPYEGAHGLMTVERNGIYTRRPFKLKRSSTWLTVPITADLQPNAYVSVVLVRGRVKVPAKKQGKDSGYQEEDPGRPTFKVGYAQLKVSQADRRLKVAVTPARPDYRPGEEAVVDLSVKDHQGKPVRAELTVIAADEGVLSLMGYKVPNPMDLFYAARGLSVRTADNRIVLLSPKMFGEKGNNPGGGGAEMGAAAEGGVRSKFVSTPFFDPAVVTDAAGKARVRFTLPDNLTTFRIMAVAVSAGAEFGASRGKIRVNKPLLLLHSLPRFFRVGDEAVAGVVVHNNSGTAGDVTIRAEAEGITLAGPTSATLAMQGEGSVEARFRYRAERPGTAKLRFYASLGDHRDGLELSRPVKLPLSMETVATYGSTERAVAEGVVPASGVRSDVGGLEVTMASTALVGLKAGLEYLLDYPYECLEQSTSRLVPLVLLGDLRQAFGLGGAGEIEPLVQKLIARIAKLQRWDGGFVYWPSSSDTYPWVSAYATWGLHRAKLAGRKVSQRVLDKGVSYLKGRLRRKVGKNDEAPWERSRRAFMVYVLADLGEKVSGHLATLFEHRDELPVFARALLLSAAVKAKAAPEMVQTLSREMTNKVQQTARGAKVEERLGYRYSRFFHSSARSTAMVLEALLAAQPDHPLVEKMATWLLEQRKNGRWRNTQETVYALLALHRYFEVREKEPPNFTAKVYLGDDKLLEQAFVGRSLEAKKRQITMAALLDRPDPGKAGTLGFVKEGLGRLYYAASLRYARKELPQTPLDAGFYISRRYEVVQRDASSMEQLRGDPTAEGEETGKTEVKAGDMVRVTLRIIVPQQMSFVALDDPLPAGLEAVNFRLMTSSRSARRAYRRHSSGSRYGGRRQVSSWYTPFYQQELRDDRVQLFADSISPGVYTHVYLARATTAGTFVAPPTHIEQMYEPEVFGRTGAVTFEVKE